MLMPSEGGGILRSKGGWIREGTCGKPDSHLEAHGEAPLEAVLTLRHVADPSSPPRPAQIVS